MLARLLLFVSSVYERLVSTSPGRRVARVWNAARGGAGTHVGICLLAQMRPSSLDQLHALRCSHALLMDGTLASSLTNFKVAFAGADLGRRFRRPPLGVSQSGPSVVGAEGLAPHPPLSIFVRVKMERKGNLEGEV